MIWIYIHEATVDCFPCSIVFIEEFELKSTRKFVTDNHFRYGFSFIHRPIFQNKFSFQLRKEERVNRLNTMNIWCCYASGYALLNSSRERTHTHTNTTKLQWKFKCFVFTWFVWISYFLISMIFSYCDFLYGKLLHIPKPKIINRAGELSHRNKTNTVENCSCWKHVTLIEEKSRTENPFSNNT